MNNSLSNRKLYGFILDMSHDNAIDDFKHSRVAKMIEAFAQNSSLKVLVRKKDLLSNDSCTCMSIGFLPSDEDPDVDYNHVMIPYVFKTIDDFDYLEEAYYQGFVASPFEYLACLRRSKLMLFTSNIPSKTQFKPMTDDELNIYADLHSNDLNAISIERS